MNPVISTSTVGEHIIIKVFLDTVNLIREEVPHFQD